MLWSDKKLGLIAGAFAAIGLAVSAGAVAAADAEAILSARCGACHAEEAGGLSRINAQRKTPEGWDMIIARMMIMHDIEVTSEERATLVKYLADTQGLAPEETADYRYILERQPAAIEEYPTEDLGNMCGRCHSWARVALVRKDAEERAKSVHFHLAQWPTTEYQYLGRDRDWLRIAEGPIAEELGRMFPLETAAWSDWQQQDWPNMGGTWRFAGHTMGVGDYAATATVTETGNDTYAIEAEGAYADGTSFSAGGTAIVYTGYEWRGSLWVASEPGTTVGTSNIHQVYAASKDGNSMSGRWFLEEADERGGMAYWVRVRPGYSEILSVMPGHLRAGETAHIAIHGTGLSGALSLGDGVTILATVEESPETVEVVAMAAANAASGARDVAVGGTMASGLFTVYQHIDHVRVEPWYAISRVGDAGGALARVTAQFEAVAFLNGPDGEEGTDDDVRIGVMPAEWSIENFDEIAAELQDTRYSGTIDENGMFMPAGAGLNPERPFATNNIGRLRIVAVVQDGVMAHEGHAELLATVQRWNDPPIR